MLTPGQLKRSYQKKKHLICNRLSEFESKIENAANQEIFEELVFCILAAGTSARMGIATLEQIRDIILTADKEELTTRLRGIYRFYNIRAGYIVDTRDFLTEKYDMKLKEHLISFSDPAERRDFLAMTKEIRGIGYKEASHFLRNIGFRGYSILDKHVVKALNELRVIDSPRPPSGRKRYLEIEKSLRLFAEDYGFDPDELDLLLWSEKTGEILK